MFAHEHECLPSNDRMRAHEEAMQQWPGLLAWGQSKAKGASLATPMWAALRPHAAIQCACAVRAAIKSGRIQAVLQLCDGRCIIIDNLVLCTHINPRDVLPFCLPLQTS